MSSSPSPLQIRAAALADAQAIARVRILSWRVAYRTLLPPAMLDGMDIDARAKRVRAWMGRSDYRPGADLVCLRDGVVIGWLNWGPSRDPAEERKVLEIRAIYALPEVWGQGVGHALLTDAIARCVAEGGWEAVVLWVLADNPRARRFYEAHGFALDGGRKDVALLGADPLEELRYRRSLP